MSRQLLMMDGLKRRPLLLQWLVALLVLATLWGGLGPALAQDGPGGSSSIVTRECDPPNQCFSSVEARQTYAAQNSCYFLEDICTEFDPGASNQAREEDRGFWGRLWDAGVGAIQYGYDFVRGLVAGLGDQISDLIDLLSDPVEAVRGLADLGRRFYEDPEGTIRSLALLIGQETVDTIPEPLNAVPMTWKSGVEGDLQRPISSPINRVNQEGGRVFGNKFRVPTKQGNVITMTVRPQYDGSN